MRQHVYVRTSYISKNVLVAFIAIYERWSAYLMSHTEMIPARRALVSVNSESRLQKQYVRGLSLLKGCL